MAKCCEAIAERHRTWVTSELESVLMVVKRKYNQRLLKCRWCGDITLARGILVVKSSPPLSQFTGTEYSYVGVDILEIDEGEYDASKPPPITQEA